MSEELQGQGAPQASQGTASPEETTKTEDKKFIDVESFNKALTQRNNKVEKTFEAKIAALQSSFDTQVKSQFEELRALLQGSKAGGASESQTQSQAQPTAPTSQSADDARVKAMEKELKKLREQSDALAKERDSERQRARDGALHNSVLEALQAKGVSGHQAKLALGHLTKVAGSTRYSTDSPNEVVFVNADGEEMPLKDGVSSWLSTDEGKFFLPPRGVNGSGDRPGGKGPQTAQSKLTPESLAALIAGYTGG